MLIFGGIKAEASVEAFDFEMEYQQTSARDMLDRVNEFRLSEHAWYWNKDDTTTTRLESLDNLAYDIELEQIAMKRAAEIAVLYGRTGHERRRL